MANDAKKQIKYLRDLLHFFSWFRMARKARKARKHKTIRNEIATINMNTQEKSINEGILG